MTGLSIWHNGTRTRKRRPADVMVGYDLNEMFSVQL